jgi:hypothetical protein
MRLEGGRVFLERRMVAWHGFWDRLLHVTSNDQQLKQQAGNVHFVFLDVADNF